jgi:hypothetical protein
VVFKRLQDNVLKKNYTVVARYFRASSFLKDLCFAAVQISRSSAFLPKKVINKSVKLWSFKVILVKFYIVLKSAHHRKIR